MAALQVVLLLAILLGLSWGQVYNGYINPLFLPRGLREREREVYRRGRLYDLRDNGYFLSRGSPYQDNDPYRRPLDYNRNEDYRRYQSLYDDNRRFPNVYDDNRRFPNVYNDNRRYPNQYEDNRRYQNQYEDNRRLPVGLDRRYSDLYRPFLESAGYQGTTVAPLDSRQFQERDDGQGLGLERGQVLSTSTPDLTVSVQPNGSA